MRAALYARFSSDLQNERSAGDQLAALRQVVAARGWTLTAEYRDEGISGAAIATRPGVMALLADGIAGRFDIVLAEDLDRLSRDQEGTAHLYKRLTHAGVVIETLTRGRIGLMHVGLEGTMNALFLENLAHKTRRGLQAVVNSGRSAGGRCFGYTPVPGQPGELAIDEAEAETVRRIFRDFGAGQSARTIAHALNAEGVAGPRGGVWTASTIKGDRQAQDGLICNRLYIGVRVWNRRRFRKHPDTGRRASILLPESEWQTVAAPALRILTDAAWEAAQAQLRVYERHAPGERKQRPRRLLSGLMRCSLCEGAMVLAGQKYTCARHVEAGACANNKRIAAASVERRVLTGIREKLLSPAAIAQAVRDYHAQAEARRRQAVAARAPAEREGADIGRRLERAQEAYLSGAMDLTAFTAATAPLKARRAAIDAQLALADPAGETQAIRLHPGAARHYRQLAESLEAVLADDDAGEVRAAVRELIDRVDFEPLPGLGQFGLQVHGKLAALLGISQTAKEKPRTLRSGVSGSPDWEVVVGAGARTAHDLTPSISFAA